MNPITIVLLKLYQIPKDKLGIFQQIMSISNFEFRDMIRSEKKI